VPHRDYDVVQERVGYAAPWAVLIEEIIVDSREFLTEQHTVVVEPSALGWDAQSCWSQIPTREYRDHEHVRARAIPDVG
jgi:hypothetical protein